MKVIALEEHFATEEGMAAWRALAPEWQDFALRRSSMGEFERQLTDLGHRRLAEMDDAGVDVQVLSYTTPGLQNLAAGDAVRLQGAINDGLARTIADQPERFQGLATLATPDPRQAAKELERAVTKLSLNGAMVYGRTRDLSLDDAVFWPIFEVAEALNAPIYLHPQSPPPSVRAAYYDGYTPLLDGMFATAGIGWHYDAGIQFIRLILSGVLDRFPRLQIILGHWGEVVLFYLDRLSLLAKFATLARPIDDYVRNNLYVTPAGIFSQRYFGWAMDVIGADRIMYSVDYPYHSGSAGLARNFLEQAALGKEDRHKVAHGNWENLIANIVR